MSKVKTNQSAHYKAKMRRALRRKETIHKKNDRIAKAENNVYGYPAGYYIREEECINEYILVDVPETTVDVFDTSYEMVMYTDYIDGEAYEYPIIVPVRKKIGTKTIPAHKRKQRIDHHYVDLPKIPRRINVTKKFYKNYSNRKIRRSNDIYNHGDYKKVYDVAWSIS